MRISVLTPSIRPEGLEITKKCLGEQTFTDFEWLVEIGLGTKHDFNVAMNKMIKRSKGEILVILQDFIKVDKDYLKRFHEAYTAKNNLFLSSPVGKVKNLDFTGEPNWDWRKTSDEKPTWQMWEIDSGACPREAMFKIGGFDEELDNYWSCDNVNVGYRAFLAGYDFGVLKENLAIAYDHDAFIPHPFRRNYHANFNNERMKLFERGLKVNFL